MGNLFEFSSPAMERESQINVRVSEIFGMHGKTSIGSNVRVVRLHVRTAAAVGSESAIRRLRYTHVDAAPLRPLNHGRRTDGDALPLSLSLFRTGGRT